MAINLDKYKLKNNLNKYKVSTPTSTIFPTKEPPTVTKSFTERLTKNINEPAYDMADNTSGIGGTLGKEAVNIAKSGAKFAKGTFDFFNPIETIKKVGQIPGAVKGYVSDIKGAGQSEVLAQQAEAKAKQLGKSPVAPQTNFANLAPNLTKAAYESVVPEVGQLALKGEGTKALESLANDPFQIAPALLMAKGAVGKGGILENTKTGKVIDTTVKTLAKPITAPASAISKLGGNLAKYGTAQATGLSPKTIQTILKNPDEFSKAKITEHSREVIGSEVYNAIQNRIETLSETGKGYEAIRKTGQAVNLVKPIVTEVLNKYGIKIDPNGKLITTAESVPLKSGDISALESFVSQYGKEQTLSANAFLNARKALSNLAEFDATKSDFSNKIAKELRSAYDAQGKTQLQGLAELDTAYAPEVKLLKQIKKDYINSDGTFKDNALSKIANLTKDGRQTVLGRLEKIQPGIGKKITVLNAVEDIANASGQKVGAYARGAVGGFVVSGGNPVAAVVAAVLSEPKMATQIIRGFGKLQKAPSSIVDKAIKLVTTSLTRDVKDIPVGLSIKDVSKAKPADLKYLGKKKPAPEKRIKVNTYTNPFPKFVKPKE